MVKLVAAVVAALVSVALLPTSPATAHGSSSGDVVTSCSTAKRASGKHVTRVRWESGRRARRVNLTARTRLFPGAREVRRFPSRDSDPRVVGCSVRENGTVLVRTRSRARYAFVPVAPPELPEPPVEPTPPVVEEPARPAAVGQWLTPTTLYAPIADEWQVDAVLAAWNAALPADRQITRTFTPCPEGLSDCMPVTVHPEGLVSEMHGGPAYGIARWAYLPGVMVGCSIELAEEVPAVERATILAHELGHCLGLPHWEHSESVMGSGARASMPAAVDLQWIGDTYGQPAP